MKNLFLTNSEETKTEYKQIMNQTVQAVADSFNASTAYSGPTPQELQALIKSETILPEQGLGWQKVLEMTKEKILPNLLRTSSTDYMPHLHSPADRKSTRLNSSHVT